MKLESDKSRAQREWKQKKMNWEYRERDGEMEEAVSSCFDMVESEVMTARRDKDVSWRGEGMSSFKMERE